MQHLTKKQMLSHELNQLFASENACRDFFHWRITSVRFKSTCNKLKLYNTYHSFSDCDVQFFTAFQCHNGLSFRNKKKKERCLNDRINSKFYLSKQLSLLGTNTGGDNLTIWIILNCCLMMFTWTSGKSTYKRQFREIVFNLHDPTIDAYVTRFN